MSLLCVNVRRAQLMGPDAQFSTYVTLKLQNVKSTTVTVKGANPNWEQDFLFETNRMDTGLVVELWNKGLLWDKLLGCYWMPLMGIQFSTEVSEGQWISLDAELVMKEGEVCGTHTPTGHVMLIEAHFEPPYEYTIEDVAEFSKKLDMFNTYMDQEMSSWPEVSHDHNRSMNQYSLYSGLSEDSDYTSDVSYPIQQHPNATSHHANSSASQFGGISSLTQKANQYNFDVRNTQDVQMKRASSFDCQPNSLQNQNMPRFGDQSHPHSSRVNASGRRLPQPKIQRQLSDDSEPLSYNSRPPNRSRKLPDIKNKSPKPSLFHQSLENNEYNRSLSQNNYFENESLTSTNTLFTPTPVKSPQASSQRPRRQQPAIPRKRSLERQGGFEHFDENQQKQQQMSATQQQQQQQQQQQYQHQQQHQQTQQQQYDQQMPSQFQQNQLSQRKLPETSPPKPYDGNKINSMHNQYSEDHTVQRQDSYESYTTSIGTEPEMYEEWNNRNSVMNSMDGDKMYGNDPQMYANKQNPAWSYNSEKGWVPNDVTNKMQPMQPMQQQTQQMNPSAAFVSQAAQGAQPPTASASTLTANVMNMTNKMVGFLGGVANKVGTVAVNKPESGPNAGFVNGKMDETQYGNAMNGRAVNQFEKKEQWKNATISESLIWQTVSEDEHYEDAYQAMNFKNESQEKEISPPYFTPSASIDQDSVTINRDAFDRRNTGAEMHGDEFVDKDMHQSSFSTEYSGMYPPQPPSALKSETRTSEPKTVTFSDQIREETFNRENGLPENASDFSDRMSDVSSVPVIPSVNVEKPNDADSGFELTVPKPETKSALTEFLPPDTTGMSKARIRWISAFNKIVSELNEVSFSLSFRLLIKTQSLITQR